MTTATRTRVLLRGCPRCKGDLFLNSEETEYACLQCGRSVDARRAMASATIDPLLAREMSKDNRRLRLVPRQMEEMNDDAA